PYAHDHPGSSAVVDFLLRILRSLVPPHDGDPKLDYRWRLNVAVSLSALILFAALAVALYIDSVPFLPGLVRQDHLAKEQQERLAVEKDLEHNGQLDVRMHLESLTGTIENLRAAQCEAKFPELKQAYSQRIHVLMDRYERFAKHAYVLPACSDLQ